LLVIQICSICLTRCLQLDEKDTHVFLFIYFLSNFQSATCLFYNNLSTKASRCCCLPAVCVLLAATRNNITRLHLDCNPFFKKSLYPLLDNKMYFFVMLENYSAVVN
jgi:hypothetical protein